MKKFLVGLGLLLGSLKPAAAAEMQAVYSLPFNPEFKEFLSYDLNVQHWSDENSRILFRYVLPEDLTGQVGMEMVMFGQYTGDNVFFQLFCDRTSSTGMCIRSGDAVACSVKFKNIPLDASVTSQFLETKYGTDRIEERKKAADSFLRDAIGTVSLNIQR